MAYNIKVESELDTIGNRGDYVAVATYKDESCTVFNTSEGRARYLARANMIAYADRYMKAQTCKGDDND